MRRLYLLASFFILTPFVLIFSIIFLAVIQLESRKVNVPSSAVLSAEIVAVAQASTPDTNVSETVSNLSGVKKDERVEKVRTFLAKHQSPLEPHAQVLVDASDLYDIDYRLMPAIAMQESNLCKKAPKDTYNCWGFGIYGKKTLGFESYEEAINAVARTLSHYYVAIGLNTPEKIMTKYTPSNDGRWAFAVNHFMEQLN